MNQEQIDFLRQVVREVRAALANQSMDSTLYLDMKVWSKIYRYDCDGHRCYDPPLLDVNLQFEKK